MKTRTLIFSIVLLAIGCVSCNPAERDARTNPYKAVELTTKSGEFVRKGSDFTFEFIRRIDSASTVDYIVSPLSMQFLLGMILNGARGATADEICKVLGYGAGELDAVNDYCLSMLLQLPALDKKTTLSIANAIFVDDGWPLLDSYEDNMAKYFKAEVANLNFYDNASSLRAINGWCSDHTGGLIPKVLDSVDPNLLAYVLNAMYFKSQWKNKFEAGNTVEEKFTAESGWEKKVMMMKQNKSYPYTENDVFKAVRLPYGNGAFSMMAFLPMEGYKLSDVAAVLAKTDWESLRYDMFDCQVDLWLPRFETSYRIKLNDILAGMGMPTAFDDAKADFKAMSDYALSLDFVQQDAFIKVDEEGTKAAVVSTGGFKKDAAIAPGMPVEFHADHTFLYLITETSTGAVLFAGRYGS